MKTLSEIKDKIEEIKNSDFKIEEIAYYGKKHRVSNLLRSALICSNAIGGIDNISKEEATELYKELDEVMKNKLKVLNPNFSEETLNNIINTYKRGRIIYPMDVFVVDDAVFHKEGVFDDFGNIHKIRTFMFEGMKPYYSVSDMYFTLDDFDFLSTQKKERLTKEDDIYTSKFISDNINSIYNKNITKPIYELNTDTAFYGNSGLVSGEISGINVYINMKFDDIGRNLKTKKECDIKLCIQNGDNITLYYVHQSFKDNEPVWSVVKTNSEVWKLTEEVLKFENKCAPADKQKVIIENNLPLITNSLANFIKNNCIDPEMRLYGINEVYFKKIDELLKFCRQKHISTQSLTILDYYRSFYDHKDVIKKTNSEYSMFYAISNEHGYVWYCDELNTCGENWNFNHGQIRELYKPFRDYGIIFEDDIYAKESEENQHILKYCRENNLFNMGENICKK